MLSGPANLEDASYSRLPLEPAGGITTRALRARGAIDLAFAVSPHTGRTFVDVQGQSAPLKIVRAFAHGAIGALAHLQNTAGGLLSGDQLRSTLALGPGAHAILTTTGATRIYRQNAGDAPAKQILTATLAAEAQAEYLPDPTVPFRNSAFAQEQRWDLQQTSRLLCWDLLMPGRTHYEEPWSFRSYANQLAIRVAGRPVALERFTLRGDARELAALTRFGRSTHLGSFYVIDGAQHPSVWLALEREVDALLLDLCESAPTPTLLYGVSSLAAHGLTVRLLDCSSRGILLAFERLRSFLKERLWRQQDPLPRKVY